ncbi:MAG: sodium:solute symporter [Bdellovibrionales bacterium]
MELSALDWGVIVVYIIAMLGLSYYLSLKQKSERDYYLGGNDMGAWPIAISTMATQCSTNSLLGAPAFVAFSAGGGLLWLQYEMALPFAMIGLIFLMLPVFRAMKVISVYAYLEERFGRKTRVAISLLFQFARAFGTGVTVYGISLVLMVCLQVPFWVAALLLGVVTIVYDSMGGMEAVVYSDVIQMIILVLAIFFCVYLATDMVGGVQQVLELAPDDRKTAIDFAAHGWGDGKTFGFWPMLFGGFFLYMAYYGTDQSQVQRELSTRSVDETNKSLFINGLLRFPLVLAYCFLGICLAAIAVKFPEFLDLIPKEEKLVNGVAQLVPNYNLAVPIFVLNYLPTGVVGLVMVGLFAAAMSSLDSVINSLSAATMRDFVHPAHKHTLSVKKEILWSKGLTVFWGVVCVAFAFVVGDISDSIIVSINKIGSLANGPILGVFLLGLLTKSVNERAALLGFIGGFIANIGAWMFAPGVSWLWWNVIGFAVTYLIGLAVALVLRQQIKPFNGPSFKELITPTTYKYALLLGAYGIIVTALLAAF